MMKARGRVAPSKSTTSRPRGAFKVHDPAAQGLFEITTMTDELERVLERVRRLLNLRDGAEGHEAEAAALAARRLLDKYQLEEKEVVHGTIGHMVLAHRVGWRRFLCGVLATINGCQMATHGRDIILAGYGHDLLLLEYMQVYFEREIEKRVKAAREADPPLRGRRRVNAWRRGVIFAIYERLKKEEAREAEEKRARADAHMTEIFGDMKKARKQAIKIDVAGYEAGAAIPLHTPMSASEGMPPQLTAKN